MRISDWSSDVCSSDLPTEDRQMVALDLPTTVPDGTRLSHAYSLRAPRPLNALTRWRMQSAAPVAYETQLRPFLRERALRLPEGYNPRTLALARQWRRRSEEHTSELQSLMRISYAVFCL